MSAASRRFIAALVLALGLCSLTLANSASDQTVDALRFKAEQGDPAAQDRLGTMYYVGRGVARDYAEAARWFQKAAEQGNLHAERQLAQMYATGLDVPRDHAESEKWSRKVREQQPPPKRQHFRLWLLGIFLTLVAFTGALFALQRGRLHGWKRLLIVPFVHLVGLLLVLNTINTYAFGVLFPKCGHNFLAASCYRYRDAGLQRFLEALGDWQMENLIFRFMMFIGLGLDVLAAWYVVYLCMSLFGRRPKTTSTA